MAPELMGATPELTGAVPELMGATPELMGATPELMGAVYLARLVTNTQFVSTHYLTKSVIQILFPPLKNSFPLYLQSPCKVKDAQ